MNKVRKKRKPDTLKVNFVVGNSGSRELNIQPVTYLFKKATHDDSGRAGGHISNSITAISFWTGLVGVVCRHEFPLKFLSIRHGER